MNTLLFDQGNDANGVNLTAHVPTKGNPWQAVTGTWYIQSNSIEPNSWNSGDLAVSLGYSADADITAMLTPIYSALSNSTNLDFVFRYQDVNNFWMVGCGGPTGETFTLYKCVAGSFTPVVTAPPLSSTTSPQFIASGSPVPLKIKVFSSTIVVLYNGVPIIQYFQATDFATATGVGLRVSKFGTPASRPSARNIVVVPTNATLLIPNPSDPIFPLNGHTDVTAPYCLFDYHTNQWLFQTSPNDSGVWSTRLYYGADSTNPGVIPTAWTEFANSPILTPSTMGQSVYAADGCGPFWIGGQYVALFLGDSGQTFIATSPDLDGGGTWKPYGEFTAAAVAFNGFDAWAKLITVNGVPTLEAIAASEDANGRYGSYNMSRYTSPDGLHWTFDRVLFNNTIHPAFAGGFGAPACYEDMTQPEFSVFCDGDWVFADLQSRRGPFKNTTYDGGQTWVTSPMDCKNRTSPAWCTVQSFDSCPVPVGSTLYYFHCGAPAAGVTGGAGMQIGVATMPITPISSDPPMCTIGFDLVGEVNGAQAALTIVGLPLNLAGKWTVGTFQSVQSVNGMVTFAPVPQGCSIRLICQAAGLDFVTTVPSSLFASPAINGDDTLVPAYGPISA